jgi:hypothetical protein
VTRDVQPIWKNPPAAKKKTRRSVKPVSDRRRSETEQRAEVRRLVKARDRVCQGPGAGLPDPCASPFEWRAELEVHEYAQRSTHPGSHLDPDLCVLLCQHHHDMVTSPVGEMRALVERVGLIVRSRT